MEKSRTAGPSRVVTSPTVRSLRLVEVLVDTKAALVELMVQSGLQVLDALLEEDRTALCSPRYAPHADRHASRAGTVPSEVVLHPKPELDNAPGPDGWRSPRPHVAESRPRAACSTLPTDVGRRDGTRSPLLRGTDPPPRQGHRGRDRERRTARDDPPPHRGTDRRVRLSRRSGAGAVEAGND